MIAADVTAPTTDGVPLDLSRGSDPRFRWAPPTDEIDRAVELYLAAKSPADRAALHHLIATTEGPTMSEHDLIERVALAYDLDHRPAEAAAVRARAVEVVGPRTLRKPSGLLITWMSCGCVVAHRAKRIGRRLMICGQVDHAGEGFATRLERDSDGGYQASAEVAA